MPRVEYSANVVEFARRLHAENGWSAHRIRKALIARGYSPAHNTVLCWIDADYAARRREDTRLAMRRRCGGGHGAPGPRRLHLADRRLQRMRELRSLRISYRSIAALMSHDFEDLELSAEQVRSIFRGQTSAKTIKKMLWPNGASA